MEALFNNLGIAFRKVGGIKHTVHKNNKAAEKNSKNAKHIMQGNAFYNLGMFKKAIKSYTRALKYYPDDVNIHLNLGNAYKKLGMLKEAVKSYKYVVHSRPNDAKAHYHLGLAYGKLKMHEQAKNSFLLSITIDPSNAHAHFNLAVIYLTLDNSAEAIKEYRILNNLAPQLAGRLSEMMSRQTI
jgi:tetratricopeptide (TPR) repeat protein